MSSFWFGVLLLACFKGHVAEREEDQLIGALELDAAAGAVNSSSDAAGGALELDAAVEDSSDAAEGLAAGTGSALELDKMSSPVGQKVESSVSPRRVHTRSDLMQRAALAQELSTSAGDAQESSARRQGVGTQLGAALLFSLPVALLILICVVWARCTKTNEVDGGVAKDAEIAGGPDCDSNKSNSGSGYYEPRSVRSAADATSFCRQGSPLVGRLDMTVDEHLQRQAPDLLSIHFTVQSASGEVLEIDAKGDVTAAGIKEVVARDWQVPPVSQRLLLDGEELQDSATFAELVHESGSLTLTVIVKRLADVSATAEAAR